MADKLSFELVSPDRLLLSTEVDMVVVPGSEGDFGVLPGHSPVISSLRHGVIDVHDGGKVAERLYVGGGFAEVNDKGLTVLAEEAINLRDLKRADLEQRIKNLKEDLEDAKTDEARLKAQLALDHLANLLSALNLAA
ncbi:MAG: F0F1 ATP synthase subunit epsilon [Alphaproteobacteria bacterium]|nr:F0F1 ATP synthase subunit epsilon [Alphaproteobacteria bacterium]